RQKVAIQQALDRPGMSGSTQIIRSIIATTLLFEITGVFLLMIAFVPEKGWQEGIWLAIFHSVSAWNNAGFSLFADNLIGYKSSIVINMIIPLLIIFGGIGYQVIIEMYIWLLSILKKTKARFVFSLNFKVVT
ncbi:MAG: potassium transporter TrkG, partial [Dolichospermum sp.]